jgi:uncharacterized coiled-coil protein SlyX
LRSTYSLVAAALVLSGTACSSATKHGSERRPSASASKGGRNARPADTDASRDSDQDKRIANLELRLLEKEAQVEDLQSRLDEAQAEVVRAMAKLRTVASRAEAASGMAEAEIALSALRAAGNSSEGADRVSSLVRQSNSEFEKQNFGGVLYLANQAKALALTLRGRATEGSRGAARSGETAFALPIKIRVASRVNVREGPGTGFAIAYSAESGSLLTGIAYTDEWVRVSDDGGRAGWIFKSLVSRP